MPEQNISRRGMLLASLGGAAALYGTRLFADEKNRGFQIGVCDWSTGKGGSPEALKAAADMGVDGIMASFGAPTDRHDLRKAENVKLYEEAAKKYGTVIASLGMGVLNNVPYKSAPETESWVSDAVDVAKNLNVKVILLAFFGKGDLKNDPAGTAEVVARLKKVAPKAEKCGVILGVESWLSADEHLRILDAVGSPAVQVYYDVGNMTKMGYDICTEIRQLGKRICEFHAKDYSNKPFGQGQVNFPDVRKAMDDVGYRGWIHLESLVRNKDVMTTYREDGAYLRTVFPKSV